MTFTLLYGDILTVIYILVGVCLIICLFYVICILRNISKAVDKTRNTIENINEFVIKPIQIAKIVYEKIGSVINNVKKQKKDED